MIIHIDTSALIDALTGPRRSLPRLTSLVHEGHRIAMSGLVYYEWRRGPRTRAELIAQESVLPLEGVVPFDANAAALAGAHLDERHGGDRGLQSLIADPSQLLQAGRRTGPKPAEFPASLAWHATRRDSYPSIPTTM